MGPTSLQRGPEHVSQAELHPDAVEAAHAIAPLLAAEAPAIEVGGRLTGPVLEALHAHGLYSLLLPRSLGGRAAGLATLVKTLEVVAAADASTAWCLSQANGTALAAAYADPAVAKEVWAAPRGFMTWGFPLEARARVVPDSYRVSGRWGFASGGHHAAWLGGRCRVVGPEGEPLVDAAGAPLERTMLFRQDQVAWTAAWDVVGLRGTGSDTYAVTDLFVPEAYSFRRDAPEERRIDEPLYRFTTVAAYACGFAGVAMGIARGMMDALAALAGAKTPSHTGRALRDSPVMHHLFAENEARLRSARAFLLETIAEAEAAIAAAGALDLERQVMMRLAATTAIQRAKQVAEFAYHEAGATAIFTANAFERRMRDIHAAAQQVQGRTNHIETCGQYFLGLTPATRFL